MSFSEYEETYSQLVADITASIGKLHLYSGRDRKELHSQIDGNLTEANELLEQLGLELHNTTKELRPQLNSKYKCYQAELKRLEKEYDNKKSDRNVLLFEDDYDDSSISIKDDQKERLLQNTEKIERTGKILDDGYRIVIETEQIGNQILQDLNHQRETIQSSRSKVRETNADLSLSSRILNTIFIRSLREKVILYVVGFCFILIVGLSIYFSLSSN